MHERCAGPDRAPAQRRGAGPPRDGVRERSRTCAAHRGRRAPPATTGGCPAAERARGVLWRWPNCERNARHALDRRRRPARPLGSRSRHLHHHGRPRPPPAGGRRHRAARPDHPGTPPHLVTTTIRAALLAIGALAVTGKARAYTIETEFTAKCHEKLTSTALRTARATLAVAPSPPVTRDDQALIDDLQFAPDPDMRDLAGATLLVGARDND